MSEVLNMSRINKVLAVDIKSNFCTRMRSLGKKTEDIAQLVLFLDLSLRDINDISRINELDK